MNRDELRAEIARKQITKRAIAEALEISEASLFLKIRGDREFKETEIRKLVDVLGMTPEDVQRIFLS